ncbi:hypothetical protein [Natronorubrum sp. DTA28]|uniref:hypothetical protein n=1 Tax=Natronorubrum sp. DTA28 TaxID=3447019 RepID=UPI003F878B69
MTRGRPRHVVRRRFRRRRRLFAYTATMGADPGYDNLVGACLMRFLLNLAAFLIFLSMLPAPW